MDDRPFQDQEDHRHDEQREDGFPAKHQEKLQRLYDRHRGLHGVDELLLFQPEALLVFERIENDPFILEQEWSRHYPPDLLEQLALLWGKPYQSVA